MHVDWDLVGRLLIWSVGLFAIILIRYKVSTWAHPPGEAREPKPVVGIIGLCIVATLAAVVVVIVSRLLFK